MNTQVMTRDEYKYSIAVLYSVEDQLISARCNLKKIMSRFEVEETANKLYIDTINALILNLPGIREQLHKMPLLDEKRDQLSA
ncbi:hypothetical protein AUK40_02975 [Candidatus Wirthbacteria bacterium CG2_30_54_11]|uniref:Uncharacterized protein n=1 Tax=Candidatus Wirthbacteria bacterium CG2_30_54_11 TaxID=1817892 RepID=A0A1J5IZ58_9BACT|nr:MAG: hypothetical protein AUK40_02975 [Candidatus Wirthbacteria bacterium CG2_30_54_11]